MIKTINLNKTVKWAVTSLLVISLQGFLIADENDKVGSVAFKFLNIETDARTAALGGTSAQASGPGAMFSNPAGLSSTSSMGLSAGLSQWLVETNITSFGFALPMAGGVVGLGVVNVDYGDNNRFVLPSNRSPVRAHMHLAPGGNVCLVDGMQARCQSQRSQHSVGRRTARRHWTDGL